MRAIYDIQEEGMVYKIIEFIQEKNIVIATVNPEWNPKKLLVFKLGEY